METLTHQVEGLLIRSLVAGEGDTTTVLVHGLGCSAESWALNIEAFASCSRVYALDLPGFGESESPEQVLPTEQLADMLATWCHEAGITRAAFVGHSLGGEVCLWLALKYPDLVTRMVLAASTGADSTVTLLERLPQLMADGLLEPVARIPSLLRDYFRATPERIIATAASSLSSELPQKLHDIRVPVLVVWGRKDRVVPLPEGGMLTAAMPAARLVVIEDAAHGVIFGSPERFNEVVCSFLNEAGAMPA